MITREHFETMFNSFNYTIVNELSEEEIFFLMISKATNQPIYPGDFTVETPSITGTPNTSLTTANANTDITADTQVKIVAKSTYPHKGFDIFNYRRLHIPTYMRLLKGSADITLDSSITTDAEAIFNAIVERFQFRKESLTYTSTKTGIDVDSVTIKAKENSLLYVGEYTFNFAEIERTGPIATLKSAGIDTNGLKAFAY